MKTLAKLAFLGLLLLPTSAHAADRYEFDTVHSQIIFFVSHMGFSNSEGEFLDFDGHYMWDPENPGQAAVELVIDTASIDMDDEKWDAHMKNEDFFDVEKHPAMTFKSTKVEVTGENTANVTGDLTLLGVTKPVTLAVVHNKTGERRGNMVSGFSATGTLNRSEWGMNYGIPMVSDAVEIRIEVEGERVQAPAEGGTEENGAQ